MAIKQSGGLRFTHKTKIMIDFLIELLLCDNTNSASVVTISKKLNVHRNYLGRLLDPLKKAGVVSTNYSGGCRFIANPEKITVLQILELVDGPASLHSMFTIKQGHPKTPSNFPELWLGIDREIRNKLNSVTVQDIIDAHVKDLIVK